MSERHDVIAFRCANADLNTWLAQRAGESRGRSARTYVVAAGSRVAGYYCLAAGLVGRAGLPRASLRRNQPEHVPVIVIGRLAVDVEFTGQGIGKGLLKDALMRSLAAGEAIGVRAVLVHAADDGAAGFYRKFGFLPFPGNGLTLALPLEAAAAVILS